MKGVDGRHMKSITVLSKLMRLVVLELCRVRDLTPIPLVSVGKPPENTNTGSAPSVLTHCNCMMGELTAIVPEGERERGERGGEGRERGERG